MNLAAIATKSLVATQEIRALPTLEAISFQKNDSFGPDLEAVIIKYMNLVKQGVPPKIIESDKELKAEFSKIVQDRLGLKVYLITNSRLAATFPNVYVRHSAMITDLSRWIMDFDPTVYRQTDLLVKKDNFKMGTVNTEKAKITGWLSEQPVPLFMNFAQLMDEADYSSAELTGICLHELGHVFEGAAMAVRVNTTNQVIADVARHVTSKGRQSDVEYVYRELKILDPKLAKETVTGLLSGEAAVMGVSAFRVVQGAVTSLSGSSVYDRTSYEAMSDSFAVRFGYGAALATGLEKPDSNTKRIIRGVGEQVLHGIALIVVINLLFSVVNACLAGAIGKAMLMLFSGLIGYAWCILGNFDQIRITNDAYDYDKGVDRIERIRRNMLEAIKNPDIDKNTRIALIEQLKAVEAISKNYIEVPPIMQKLISSIFAEDRRASASIQSQQQMESLIANDIFMAAAKLSSKV